MEIRITSVDFIGTTSDKNMEFLRLTKHKTRKNLGVDGKKVYICGGILTQIEIFKNEEVNL